MTGTKVSSLDDGLTNYFKLLGTEVLQFSPNLKWTYNKTYHRVELYYREDEDHEWILDKIHPGRSWKDSFIYPAGFISAMLGYSSELTWGVNGRRGGAVDPNASNFTSAGKIGGGLIMKALTGGNNDDYTAIHWGSSYVTTINECPHMKIKAEFKDSADVAYLSGLVDNTRSTANNAFALPDNGIYVYYDTDVDTDMHFVVRSGGVDQYNVNLGSIPASTTSGVIRMKSCCCDTVELIFDGVKVTEYSGTLPTVQMMPYAAVVIRDSTKPDKELSLEDFELIINY